MRFAALLGSPNAAGRTRVVADAIAEGVAGADGSMQVISLADESAIESVLDACDRADGLIMGCPVYRGGMAYPLKTLLDHMPRGMWGDRSRHAARVCCGRGPLSATSMPRGMWSRTARNCVEGDAVSSGIRTSVVLT